jgi:hypothetical protein
MPGVIWLRPKDGETMAEALARADSEARAAGAGVVFLNLEGVTMDAAPRTDAAAVLKQAREAEGRAKQRAGLAELTRMRADEAEQRGANNIAAHLLSRAAEYEEDAEAARFEAAELRRQLRG